MLSPKVYSFRSIQVAHKVIISSLLLLPRRHHLTYLHNYTKGIVEAKSINRYSKPIYLSGILYSTSTNKMDTKEELKKRLTPIQYQVTQESATERPFTGKYNKCYDKGIYRCIVCHEDLFTSDTKYDSGCGWPAFNDVLEQGKITLHKDASLSGTNLLLLIKNPDRVRTEVRCAKCGAHMGHVFEDGPKPTRKRYCINSASIDFISAEQLNQEQQQNKS